MKFYRSIFATVLLCAFAASPCLACVKALAEMSQAEMACCKKMAGDCGAMKNAEHSCCQKIGLATNDAAMISAAQRPEVPLLCTLLPQSASSTEGLPFGQLHNVLRQSHSPPIINEPSLVLRI